MFSTLLLSRKTVYTLLSLTSLFVPLGPVLASDCEFATELPSGPALRGYADESVRLLRLELPAAGVVTVDLAAPALHGAPRKIDLFRADCGHLKRTPDASILEQSATHLVLAVQAPGTLLFRAAAEDPEEALGTYKVTASFVEAEVVREDAVDELGRGVVRNRFYRAAGAARKSDPEHNDPDPNGAALDGAALLASFLSPLPERVTTKSDPENNDPDPNGLRSGGPGHGGSRQVLFYEPTCLRGAESEADDHADTPRCATPLALGHPATGELGNAWGDDADVFLLSLDELTTVEVFTSGDADTFGGLYDRSGQRLSVADDGAGGANFRIVTTLAPGRYYVRVEGGGGAGGPYTLSAVARDRRIPRLQPQSP